MKITRWPSSTASATKPSGLGDQSGIEAIWSAGRAERSSAEAVSIAAIHTAASTRHWVPRTMRSADAPVAARNTARQSTFSARPAGLPTTANGKVDTVFTTATRQTPIPNAVRYHRCPRSAVMTTASAAPPRCRGPGVEVMSTFPPTRSIRAITDSLNPRPASIELNPAPSSLMATSNPPSTVRAATVAASTPACRSTLVRASPTARAVASATVSGACGAPVIRRSTRSAESPTTRCRSSASPEHSRADSESPEAPRVQQVAAGLPANALVRAGRDSLPDHQQGRRGGVVQHGPMLALGGAARGGDLQRHRGRSPGRRGPVGRSGRRDDQFEQRAGHGRLDRQQVEGRRRPGRTDPVDHRRAHEVGGDHQRAEQRRPPPALAARRTSGWPDCRC